MKSIRNKQSIGITFLDKTIFVVLCEKKSNGVFYVKKNVSETFNNSLFQGEENDFYEALTWVAEEVKNINGFKGIPIHLSLPDPIFFTHTFIFDSLPDKATDDFIAWKLCNLFHLDKDEYSFQNSFLSKSSENSVLSLAVERKTIKKIEDGFLNQQLPLMSINNRTSSNFYALKPFYKKGCGVHVFIEQDSWSIYFWDENENLQTIKSRWINNDDPAEVVWPIITTNLERILRSYINSHTDVIIKNMYVTGENSSEFVSWASNNKSLNFQLMNNIESVKLSDTCSISEVLVAM